MFSYNKGMEALHFYTKRNIQDYLRSPAQNYDKEYLKERKEIRKCFRKDDLDNKFGHPNGLIIWVIF